MSSSCSCIDSRISKNKIKKVIILQEVAILENEIIRTIIMANNNDHIIAKEEVIIGISVRNKAL